MVPTPVYDIFSWINIQTNRESPLSAHFTSQKKIVSQDKNEFGSKSVCFYGEMMDISKIIKISENPNLEDFQFLSKHIKSIGPYTSI